MLFVPISFVAGAFILLLAVRLLRSSRDTGPLLPTLLFMLAALGLLVGLRWGYAIMRLMPLQIALALALPPLAYLSFLRLGERPVAPDLVHALSPLVCFVAGAIWPPLYDVLIPLLAFVYAGLAARLAWGGADRLPGTKFSQSATALKALWICVACLILAGLTDAAVALNFAVAGGTEAAMLVSASQTVGLLVGGLAVALAGDMTPAVQDSPQAPVPTPPSDDERTLVARIEDLVLSQRLHLSADLTLNRLARRARVPARRVSQAVNKVRGESVSRFINRIRVEEACRLLETTSATVTEVMGGCGFQTKSNFNRAFREVTGMGPAEWRQASRTTGRPTARLPSGSASPVDTDADACMLPF